MKILRFSEFDENWKPYKIGDISKTYSGGTPSTSIKEYYEGDIPFIKSGEISNYKTEQYINENAINNSSAKKVKKGDLLLALYGATSGEVAISKLDGAINQAVLKIDNNMDNYFQYNYFLKYKNQIVHKYIQGGQGNLSANIIKKLEFKFPEQKEQQKISLFLSLIDNKLDLLNDKHQSYLNFKKYLMQQIFAQKLRFSNEEWGSEKLGQLCKITMGQSPSSKNYSEDSNDTVLIQGNADIIGGKIVPRVYTSQITKTSKPGDIILTVRAPVGDLAINEFNSCIGRGVCSIEGDKFIYYSLQFLKEKHVWEKYSQGSTFESINSNDLNNLKINIPSQFEQKKIVNVLSNVDNKLELLYQNINDVKKFKEGLLQQMFI